MKLRALNGCKLDEYGYTKEIGYDNPDFHGHQIGICIGMLDTETKDIVENMIGESYGDKEKRDSILNDIIKNEDIIKVEKNITQLVDGQLKTRTLFYLPYAVADHTAYQPTANFSNIVAASNVVNHTTVEILFVEDNLNRYITYSYDAVNISIMDEIYDYFNNYSNDNLFDGLTYQEDGEEGPGYYLDFYDEAGEKFMLCFSSLERLRDSIVSVRLLDVVTEITKES